MAKMAPALAQFLAQPEECRVIGQFRLKRQLGRGAFAPVFLARQVFDNTELLTAAVKLFSLDSPMGVESGSHVSDVPGPTTRTLQREQILAEAKALCTVDNPNVVKFHSFAIDPNERLLGLVMEYLDGPTLAEQLDDLGTLDPRATLEAGCAIASALVSVHANGVVHRDIKPQNIILANGIYKLIDFGIAEFGAPRRVVEQDDGALAKQVLCDDLPLEVEGTRLTELACHFRDSNGNPVAVRAAGTLGYTDPEAIREGTTESSDLYSLGATLFECLTGYVPSVAAARLEGTTGHKGDVQSGRVPAPSISELVKGVDAELAQLIAELLLPTHENRPRSAQLVLDRLCAIRDRLTNSDIPQSVVPPPHGLQRLFRTLKYRHATTAIAATVVVATCFGALAWWNWSSEVTFYCVTLEYKFGAPICVGEVSGSTQSHRAETYRFNKRRGRVTQVTLVNGHGVPKEDSNGEVGHRFEYLDNGQVSSEIVTDLAHDILYRKHFASGPGQVELKTAAERTYKLERKRSDPELRTVPTLISKIRYTYDKAGWIATAQFFTAEDVPTTNEWGVFAVRYKRNGEGIVIEESALDYEGRPMPEDTRTSLTTYRRNDQGELLEAQFFDVDGNPAVYEQGGERIVRQLDRWGNVVAQQYLNSRNQPMLGAEGFALWKCRRDEHGDVLEELHFDQKGQPTTHKNGFFKLAVRQDGRGNAIEVAFFDSHGGPTTNAQGTYRLRRRFDMLDRLIEETYLDANGMPAGDRNGLARYLRTYDVHHNKATEEAYFDKDGNPLFLESAGFARTTSRFDARGNEVERRFFGPLKTLVLVAAGYAGWNSDYDSSENETQRIYVGIRGERLKQPSGEPSWEAEYKDGRQFQKTYIDGNGNPFPRKDNHVCKERYGYDNRGNMTLVTYRDCSDQLLINKTEGCAGWSANYDARGNRTTFTYLGIDLKPANNSKKGYAREDRLFDVHGNPIDQRYFDAVGNRALSIEGYSHVVARYDARGKTIEAKAFDVNDKLVVEQQRGVAAWTSQYDTMGNPIRTEYFGPDGKPVLSSEGCWSELSIYDAQGRALTHECLDTAGKLTLNNDGFARQQLTYDSRGNLATESFFNEAGQPTATKSSKVASFRYQYDNRGRRILEEYFGVGQQPTLNRDGISKIRSTYDERGNLVGLSWLGPHGEPSPDKEGIARWARRFDDRQNIIEWSYFNADAEPTVYAKEGYARTTSVFDEHGRPTENSYFGVDGKPILNKDGVARWTQSYNADGIVTGKRFFGADGKPVKAKLGYYGSDDVFDEHGNNTRTTLLGSNNRPMMGSDGWAAMKRVYDKSDRLILETYLSEEDTPVVVRNGYASVRYDYDSRGNVAGKTYLNQKDGFASDRSSGASHEVYRYDDVGRQVELSLLDGNNNLIIGPEGFARKTTGYDALGNVVDTAFWNTAGALVENRRLGYSHMTSRFERSKEVESAYFDSRDRPKRGPNGCAKEIARYDALGNQVLGACLDEHEHQAVSTRWGFARVEVAYDARGNCTRVESFDASDSPAIMPGRGWAKAVFVHNDRSNETEARFFDGQGKRVELADGCSGHIREFSSLDMIKKDVCVGNNDNPKLDRSGVAIYEYGYDGFGNKVEATTRDVHGRLVARIEGAARLVTSYDARQRPISVRYYGVNGEPVMSARGYARLERTLDDKGKLTRETTYAPNGKILRQSVSS